VNGIRQDFEMQTVHSPTPSDGDIDFKAAVLGIMFSVNDSNVEITENE